MVKGNIFIGTSGWVYKEWANEFYQGLKPREHFAYYATQFSTVEINATFYRLPTPAMVRGWRDRAPEPFVFSIKGSRFITHIKRLNNLGHSLANFIRRLQPLRPRLGPILWQLPPNLGPDLPRLEKFLKRLPEKYSHAIEFRHPDWFSEPSFALLRKYRMALVSVSSLRMPVNFSVTTDFVYIRFHGLTGGPQHDYSEAELKPWARHIRSQARAGRNVHAYFNNDLNVRAPNNAKLLMSLCGEAVVHPF